MLNDVTDRPERHRFELEADGAIAFAAYQRQGDTIVFTHTEVPESLRGGGIGGRLISGALAIVRDRGERIVPECAFVRAYVEAHPDAQDLLA